MIINTLQSIHLELQLTDEERLALSTTMTILEDLQVAISGKGCDTINLGDGYEATVDHMEEARTLLSDLIDGLGENEIY